MKVSVFLNAEFMFQPAAVTASVSSGVFSHDEPPHCFSPHIISQDRLLPTERSPLRRRSVSCYMLHVYLLPAFFGQTGLKWRSMKLWFSLVFHLQGFLSFFLWSLWTTPNSSHRGDSPDFRRQCLLEPPLQILHIGRLRPGDERRTPLLRGDAGGGV